MNILKQHPKAFYILIATEIPELFGRFSITAILVLYLTQAFHMSDAAAFGVYSTYLALLFTTPILGGFICDRLLGYRQSILTGSILMTLGNLCMAIPRPLMVYLWPEY